MPNFIPEYSIWKPATISDSASERSKGARPNSAIAEIKKITAVVTKIAVEGGYDMILEKNGTVIYARDGMEMTNQVIKLYNKTHPQKKRKK